MLQYYCLRNFAQPLLWTFVCAADPDTPTKPTITDIQQNSVTLSWQPGASQVINRTSILYKKGSEEDWQSQLVTSSSDDASRSRRSTDEFEDFVLGGLESGTSYIISVEVQSFDKVSRSIGVAIETRESCLSFSQRLSQEFSRRDAWRTSAICGNLV